MTRAVIIGAACTLLVAGLVLAVMFRASPRDEVSANGDDTPSIAVTDAAAEPAAGADQGFLYGHVTSVSGSRYEGRLRFGGNQEAFWGDYFNGTKADNPWVADTPMAPAGERRGFEIFGLRFGSRGTPQEFARPFMARFGDIARIDGSVQDVRVTLKSGTVFVLDRSAASDFDDGVRVWDRQQGVVNLDWARTIEFVSTVRLDAVPERLHGTVRTSSGDFSGFVQWDRNDAVGTDTLDGRGSDGAVSLPFDTIASIARRSRDSSLVTLRDGREVVLSDSREVGHENLGIYVDDVRYGRVLVSWEAFERFDVSSSGSGPAYNDFPPGQPLTGTVITAKGQRLNGRLVYDLDESETTETLDAPAEGVDYTILFGLIAAIVPADQDAQGQPRASVTLHRGETLMLRRAGDLSDANAGMLIFVSDRERPEFVSWANVARIEFDRPAVMYSR